MDNQIAPLSDLLSLGINVDADQLYLLGSVSLVSLVVKICLLRMVDHRAESAQAFCVLVWVLVGQGLCESLAYFIHHVYPKVAIFASNGYMIFTYLLGSAAVSFILCLIQSRFFRIGSYMFYGAGSVLVILHMMGFLVLDYKFIGYSWMRVPGELYPMAEGFVVLCAIVCPLLLLSAFSGASARKDYLDKIRYGVALCGVASGCLCAISIIVAMRYVQVSSAIVLPIIATVFIYTLWLSTRINLFQSILWIRTFIYMVCHPRHVFNLQTHIDAVEKLHYVETLRLTKGSQKHTARLLNVSPSTVRNKIAKYDIQVDVAA